MPELPEVNVFVSKLRKWVPHGTTIESGKIKRGASYLPGDQLGAILNQPIQNIYRRGKFIVFEMSQGLLVGHNAMSGFWDLASDPWTFDYVEGARQSSDADVRLELNLSSGEKLRFHDARLFGSLKYYSSASWQNIKSLNQLGPEALFTPEVKTEACTLWAIDDLIRICHRSTWPIKALLMDQPRVAGIGNIYAAEALWRASIRPQREGKSLSLEELYRLYLSTQDVLGEALKNNLKYDTYLKVYRKSRCPQCKTGIQKEDVKGRTSYFCPRCQI